MFFITSGPFVFSAAMSNVISVNGLSKIRNFFSDSVQICANLFSMCFSFCFKWQMSKMASLIRIFCRNPWRDSCFHGALGPRVGHFFSVQNLRESLYFVRIGRIKWYFQNVCKFVKFWANILQLLRTFKYRLLRVSIPPWRPAVPLLLKVWQNLCKSQRICQTLLFVPFCQGFSGSEIGFVAWTS